MIDLMSVAYHLKIILYYGYCYSYTTGQFLVNLVYSLCMVLVYLSRLIVTFYSVLIESISVFIFDILLELQSFINFVAHTGENIITFISGLLAALTNGIDSVVFSISFVYNAITNGIIGIVANIGQIFIFIKRLFVLFGSGVWFALTLIPLLVIYLTTLFTYFIGRLCDEIHTFFAGILFVCKTLFVDAFHFVTDVPAESLAGILAGICIIYIFIQFYMIIIAYIAGKIISIFLITKDCLIGSATRLWITMSRQLRLFYRRQPTQIQFQQPVIRGRELTRSERTLRPKINSRMQIRSSQPSLEDTEKVERFCVICEDRVKCILVLPCRHVCMCSECLNTLRHYNNSCPICRRNIESTMKIFI